MNFTRKSNLIRKIELKIKIKNIYKSKIKCFIVFKMKIILFQQMLYKNIQFTSFSRIVNWMGLDWKWYNILIDIDIMENLLFPSYNGIEGKTRNPISLIKHFLSQNLESHYFQILSLFLKYIYTKYIIYSYIYFQNFDNVKEAAK